MATQTKKRKSADPSDTTGKERPNKLTFTKSQILQSERFEQRRDLLGAILPENGLYTMDGIETRIQKFMKGGK